MQRQSWELKKRKAAEKRGPLVKKMAQNYKSRGKNKDRGKTDEKGRERETDRLVFLSRLCGMTSLCTAAVFVNQGQGCLLDYFLGRKEGRRGREKKREREKEGRELRH